MLFFIKKEDQWLKHLHIFTSLNKAVLCYVSKRFAVEYEQKEASVILRYGNCWHHIDFFQPAIKAKKRKYIYIYLNISIKKSF